MSPAYSRLLLPPLSNPNPWIHPLEESMTIIKCLLHGHFADEAFPDVTVVVTP